MASLNKDETQFEFDNIITKLSDDSISIDDRLELITKDLCKIETNRERTFLIYLFSSDDINIDICFYKKVISLTDNIDKQDKTGMTATMMAFRNNDNSDVLFELLKQKPDLNITNNYGCNVLMQALTYKIKT